MVPTGLPRSRNTKFLVAASLLACAMLRVEAVEPTFRKPVRYRSEGRETAAQLQWDAASKTLSLAGADGKALPWPGILELVDPAPVRPAPTPVEWPDEAVAVLGFRERLSGRIRAVRDRAEVAWSIGDSPAETKFDSASAYAWALNPGKSTLLFRSFEDSSDNASFEPTGAVPDGRRMLKLSGTRRETLLPAPFDPNGRALYQVAFEEAQAAQDNGPLTISIFTETSDEPAISVRLDSKDDTWELSSPSADRKSFALLPRKPGMHRLGILVGEGRVRFCVDEAVAHTVRENVKPGSISAVAISAEAARPRHVDALCAFSFRPTSKTLQWPIEDDSIRLAGGNEWLGTVKNLESGIWTLADGDRQRRIPLGLTESWIPPSRQSVFRWVSGTVVELTFFRPSASLWNLDPGANPFESLGLIVPPDRGLDRVEGAVENCDAEGITLRLSQGGAIRVPFDRLVSIAGTRSQGLRIVDSRPRHLGDEVDLRVIPPAPQGNLLELTFEANAEEAGWPIELAVDVLEVLGADSPRFGDLIRKGELVTEVRLNDVELGMLNDKVSANNEAPERVRLDVPAGSLKPGTNRIEFRLKGRSNDPNYLDDLSILGVRLYRKS